MHDESVARTRVKICGITRPEDGGHAAAMGADAIGLVFYAKSPRAVDVAQAKAILAALPAFVTTVGLFVDAPAEEVNAVLDALPLDLLQFHGNESPAYCRAFRRPYLKALAMRPGMDLRVATEDYVDARALLVDAYHPDAPGGTGTRFDWERLPAQLGLPLVLAGGLDPDNIADAIRTVRPWGVDVSSGVEAAKGIKSPEKMAAFMRGVESAR
ncbi:MAG: phosphoribosylanthranilate isomerase [Thiohalomonadaceae bacterium]